MEPITFMTQIIGNSSRNGEFREVCGVFWDAFLEVVLGRLSEAFLLIVCVVWCGVVWCGVPYIVLHSPLKCLM